MLWPHHTVCDCHLASGDSFARFRPSWGYAHKYFNKVGEKRYVNAVDIFNDLKRGIPGLDVTDYPAGFLVRHTVGLAMVNKYSRIFNGIHYYSFPDS